MMLCSGNDTLLGNKVLSAFAAYLDRSPGVELVYGQENDLSNTKSHEWTFTIPEKARRKLYNNLTDCQCHNIATWLYYFSESLWGMYRTDQVKLLNIPYSYGSDHVWISSISLLGGISGIRLPVRQVSSNSDRGLEGLRSSQIMRQYSDTTTILTPLENTNFMMLSYTYFQGIRDSHLINVNRDQLVLRTNRILRERFPARIKEESLIYQSLLDPMRALALANNDLQLIHRIETEDSFVRLYMRNLLESTG
jgi:hypothetical protein